VVPADVADQYNTEEAVAGLSFAVEAGSAGEAVAKEKGYEYTSLQSQADTLMEVAAGTSEASIIDLLMAGAMIGEGTSYADLTYTVGLNEEEYGVGFRKGSDLAAALNQFFKDSYADGTMMEIAQTYGVQESIIEQ
jgi:polar amino acid transport system substrate-binding protein